MKVNKRLIGCISAVVLVASVNPLYAFADNIVTDTIRDLGEQIVEDTRYSLFSFADSVQNIWKGAAEMYAKEWTGGYFIDNPVKNSAVSSLLVNQYLADYANNSTGGSYTIKDSYTFIAKRRIIYPYDNMAETDYMFCFVDENVDNYTVQQFGDNTISPNSILLVRQTNFDGVKVCSIPLEYNEITVTPGGANSLFELRFSVPDNNTFVTHTPEGTVTYQFRHSTGWNESGMTVINNQYNDIINTNLVSTYEDSSTFYHYYIAEGEPLNDLECFFGTGYAYEMGQGIMSGLQPWYISSGYINTQYDSQLLIDRTNNNINGTINPKYSPVYIVNNNSPLKAGNTINEFNISNYNDYGITYDNVSNEFDLDIPVLAAALGAAITPTFEGIFDGTFDLQPEIGADFSLDPELEFNWPDLVDDFIDSITVQLPGGGWVEPSYPAVNTSAYIPATYPVVPTATYPANYLSDMGDTLNEGWDLFDALGLLAFLIPIVIFCALWRFTGG